MKYFLIGTIFILGTTPCFAEEDEFSDLLEEEFTDEAVPEIADPLQPLNELFFDLNQLGFDYVLKPIAITYDFITPRAFQRSLDNAIYNFYSPIPIVNSLLQGNLSDAGKESARTITNSTIGIAGLIDVADPLFGMERTNRDLDQTLGKADIGWGIYGYAPMYGPGSIREAFGVLGDSFLIPTSIIFWSQPLISLYITLGVYGVKNLNRLSMNIELYDNIYRDSFDPYSFVKTAYLQNNLKRVKE